MDQQIAMERAAIEDRWLWNVKVFGQIFGLWPDQVESKKYWIRCTSSFLLLIFTVTQIAPIIKNYNVDILTDHMPFLMFALAFFLKYFTYVLNENRVRTLFNVIVSDFMEKRPKEEIEIMASHTNKALFFAKLCKVSMSSMLTSLLSLPFIPPVLDIIAPLNKSRDHVLPVPADYFVDEQRFYYPILSHIIMCAFIVAGSWACSDVIFAHLCQHGCALLDITGYRFKHVMDSLELHEKEDIDYLMKRNFAQVIDCIKAHQKADEYIKIVVAIHKLCFGIGIIMVVITFTSQLIKLTSLEMGSTFITFAAISVGALIHIGYLAVFAQFLSDSSEEIFHNICEAQWYNASTKSQALYLLVLRKCLTFPKLTAGGFMDVNLAVFVQIVKMSFSYYTVLKKS